MNIKSDAIEIIKRLKERNPDFLNHIKDESITLEDLAEIIITQYCAFNNYELKI